MPRILVVVFVLLIGLIGKQASAQDFAIIGAVHGFNNKIYMFLSDGEYVRYDRATFTADENYPQPVTNKNWPGLAPYVPQLVAAFNGPNKKLYFFLADGTYLRYDLPADKIDLGPKPIDDRTWPGLARFRTNIVGVLDWKDDKYQMFLSDGTYLRYDIATDRVEDGYPRPVNNKTWPGVGPYANNLAGMLNMFNGKAYMFLTDNRYLRYDIAADRVDPGYPKPVRRTVN